MLRSPHLWLVNICRTSCGFCQALTPAWSAVAHRLRQEVRVAYWDAELHGRPPDTLGTVNVTPTIRAFVPQPLSGDPMHIKDYSGSRTSVDLTHFARALLPDLVEPVSDGSAWERVEEQAIKQGIPRLLLFTARPANATTPPILKSISSAFARRVLVVEVRLDGLQKTGAFAARTQLDLPPKLPAACIMTDQVASMTCIDASPTYARLEALAEEGVKWLQSSLESKRSSTQTPGSETSSTT